MEKYKSYTTNKNLELKQDNIIIKKGTNLVLTNVFDLTDDKIPTVFNVKFENINGNYLFKESEFQTLINNNSLIANPDRKFKDGDCIKLADGRQGKIEDEGYDVKYSNFADSWLYKIKLSDESFCQAFEVTITKC